MVRGLFLLALLTSCGRSGVPGLESGSGGAPEDAGASGEEGDGCSEWTSQFGGPGTDHGRAVAIDSEGGVYVVGVGEGGLDGHASFGELDAFLTKLGRDGEREWTRTWGTGSNDWAYGIAVDEEGALYVTGGTLGALDGNANAGQQDIFVARYLGDGTKSWTRPLGSPRNDWGESIAAAGNGQIYVVGFTEGELGADESRGGLDAFLASYDRDGTLRWLRQFGSEWDDEALAVAADEQGNAYVVGETFGALDGEASAGGVDMFVTKYDAAGERLWTRQLGTPSSDWGEALALDQNGWLYVAGTTDGALGGTPGAGKEDAFLAQYDLDGNLRWAKPFGTVGSDLGFGVAVEGDGRVVVTGYTDGDLDGYGNAGMLDAFVAAYGSDGERRWGRQWGTALHDGGRGVAVDVYGGVYAVGTTEGVLGAATSGEQDAYLRRICVP